MIPVPSGVRAWLATGHCDMRKGYTSLSVLVQETLKHDPHAGHLFVFRGRRGDRIKIIWHELHLLSASVDGFSNCCGSIDKTVPSTALLARHVRYGNLV